MSSCLGKKVVSEWGHSFKKAIASYTFLKLKEIVLFISKVGTYKIVSLF